MKNSQALYYKFNLDYPELIRNYGHPVDQNCNKILDFKDTWEYPLKRTIFSLCCSSLDSIFW